MKWWRQICCLILLLPTLALAQNKQGNGNDCFVRILCDQNQLIVGDSCLLTVVVYAPQPFLIKNKPVDMQVRNGALRDLRIGRQQLQRVVENRYIYYALVCEQYVLRTDKVGKVTIPERDFNIEMQIQEQSRDPFDVFFGRPGKIRRIPAKAIGEKFQIDVIDKPKRTMMEMKRSGVQVL